MSLRKLLSIRIVIGDDMPLSLTRAAPVAALIALLVVLTSCSAPPEAARADGPAAFTEFGPITLASGKEPMITARVAQWNQQHPDEHVTLIELPHGSDNQRQQMIQNANTKSDAFTVLNMDCVWTAEFAAHRWIQELPEGSFPLRDMIRQTVDMGRYRGRLYAVPWASDGGLLYYRTDLLTAAGIRTPPTTYAELKRQCDTVLALPDAKGVACYAGQFDEYEGLTVNATEFINAAGGRVIDRSGVPTTDTPEARTGLNLLVDWYADGTIPRNAITFKEEQGRQAFVAGKLLFHRNWAYLYNTASTPSRTNVVIGKFAVAPLPGFAGPGTSTLGGHDLGISTFGKNKGTALRFIQWFTSEDIQRRNLADAAEAPTYAALYGEPELVHKYPYLPALEQSVQQAIPRPSTVRYPDVTAAIQSRVYAAMTGATTAEDALAGLQKDLTHILEN